MGSITKASSSAASKSDASCDATTTSCPPSTPPPGEVALYAAAVDVKYDVCDDKIAGNSDFGKVFLLKDSGKYYHWLKTRTDAADMNKPGTSAGPIPVTLAGKEPFKITITFKTIEPWSGFFVRVRDTSNKYTFTAEEGVSRNSGAKGALFELSFTCDTPLPYDGTIQYLPAFSLAVEVSKAGGTWTSLGSIPLCLYLTLEPAGYASLFETPLTRTEDMTSKLKNTATSRSTILETLLYIGCRYASGAKTAPEIISGIFGHIKTLAVSRARDPAVMGYWRNTSSLHLNSMAFRNGRVLLKSGEARCGEWTRFLGDLLLIQAESLFSGKMTEFAIVNGTKTNPGWTNSGFLVKPWTLRGNLAPVDGGGRAQDTSNKPLNLFWDHVFLLFDKNYYDPSYGLVSSAGFADNTLLLHDYSDKGLAGVILSKDNSTNPPIDSIRYLGAPNVYLDPMRANLCGPTNTLRYDIVTTNMEQYLQPSANPR